MKKILVADDHSVVREGIIRSLSDSIKEVEFRGAASAAETLALVCEENWDLLVLDISMPGRDGLDVLNSLKKISPSTPVIFLSMYPADQFAIRTLKSGASGYLTKDCTSRELVRAIKTVLAGNKYISPAVAELLTEEVQNKSAKSLYDNLSDREMQVFLSIASGKTVSEIARDLSLSVKTISIYRANILRKTKMKNNAELMHYAIKNGLVD